MSKPIVGTIHGIRIFATGDNPHTEAELATAGDVFLVDCEAAGGQRRFPAVPEGWAVGPNLQDGKVRYYPPQV